MLRFFLIFIIILSRFSAVLSQSYEVSGLVKDSRGESVIGARITEKLSGVSTVSNDYGFYSFSTQLDSIVIVAESAGKTAQITIPKLKNDTSVYITLEREISIEEIIILPGNSVTNRQQGGKIDLPVEVMEEVPALLGEPDILKLAQHYPGISSGAEGSADLIIRGGTPDQNLVLLDDAGVYNSGHLGGLVSVFNPFIIKKATLFKSGFPASYGGRLSSVTDIRTIDGNTKKLKGRYAIGLLSSNFLLEGPLFKDKKLTFVLAARRSLYDLLTVPISKLIYDYSAGVFFYDLNAKLTYRLNPKSVFFASLYKGRDKFFIRQKKPEIKNLSSLSWGNMLWSGKYIYQFKSNVFADFSLTGTKYDFSAIEEHSAPEDTVFREFSSLTENLHFNSKIEISQKYFSSQIGFSYKHSGFTPSVDMTKKEDKNKTAVLKTDALSFFVNQKLNFKKLKAHTGIRFSNYFVSEKVYSYIEPRFLINWQIAKPVHITASYDKTTQALKVLSNSLIGLPTDLYIPASKENPPQISEQLSLEVNYKKETLNIGLSGYLKKMQNLVEYKGGAGFLLFGGDWKDKVTSGSGHAYGIEFFTEITGNKISIMSAFTWSRSLRTFDEIDNGAEFPYKYDRPIVASLIVLHSLSSKWTITGTWNYYSGANITVGDGVYPLHSYFYFENRLFNFDNNTYRNAFAHIYPGRNNYRLPAYHRLDIGLQYKKNAKTKWNFGVYNAYNQKNAFTYLTYMNDEGTGYTTGKLVLFPLLPYIRYSRYF
jgi:hypothetical protein